LKTQHGFSGKKACPKTHKVYQAMREAKRRCETEGFKNYHDKGISFEFDSVIEAVNYAMTLDGWDNPEFSIDRIEVNSNYCRDNLRWTDRTTQQHNRGLSPKNKSGRGGIREYIRKGNVYYETCLVHEGKRYRKSFSTLVEANAWLDAKQLEILGYTKL
jgi:hypothetical protein